MMRRYAYLFVSMFLATALVACSSPSSNSPRTPDPSAGSVTAIEPASPTVASLGDFTVTIPAAGTTGPGELSLAEAGAAPELDVPGLTFVNGLSVVISGTELSTTATVTLENAEPSQPDALPIVVWEDPDGGVQLLPTEVRSAGGTSVIEATTDHFSMGWFGWLDPSALAEEALDEFSGYFTGRANVEQPTCTDEEGLRDSIDVSSDEGDAIKWCAGLSEGKASVTIANNRRTFTQVSVPREWTISDDDNGVSIAQIVRTLGTGAETFAAAFPADRTIVLISAGQSMTFTAPTAEPTSATLIARSSMAGYLLQILAQALDMWGGMMKKFGVTNPWNGNMLELLRGAAVGVPGELYTAWADCFRSFTDNVSGEPWNSPESERIPKLTLFAIDCFSAISEAGITSAPGMSGLAASAASTLAGVVGSVMGLMNSLSASVRGLYDEITALGEGRTTTYSIRLQGPIVLTKDKIGDITLPVPVEDLRRTLVAAFGEPDEDRSYSGCAAEVAGPAYAVTRDLRWGDFVVSGDGPTSQELDISYWFVSGEDLPIPMSTPLGWHFGENLFDLTAVGGTYDELFRTVDFGTGVYYYGDDDYTVVTVRNHPGCD